MVNPKLLLEVRLNDDGRDIAWFVLLARDGLSPSKWPTFVEALGHASQGKDPCHAKDIGIEDAFGCLAQSLPRVCD